MNQKKLLALALILAALVAGYFFKLNMNSSQNVITYSDLLSFFPESSSKGDVAAIVIQSTALNPDQKADRTELKKGESEWVVTTLYNATASPTAIENLLSRLQKLKGEYRSDSPEVLADFELNPEKALSLQVIGDNGKDILNMLVGKSSWKNSFARQKGSNAVYVLKGDLKRDLGFQNEKLDNSRWWERSVLNFSPADAGRVIINSAQGETVLVQQPTPAPENKNSTAAPQMEWVIASSAQAANSTLRPEEIVTKISQSRAKEVISGKDLPLLTDKTAWPYNVTVEVKNKPSIWFKARKNGNEVQVSFGPEKPVYIFSEEQFADILN